MVHRLLTCLLICATLSCTYEVEDELSMLDCDDNDISYSQDIVPLLITNCLGCHGAGIGSGGVTLEGYENLKIFVDNGLLLGALKHESGFSPMPQNAAMLPACPI